MNYENLVRRIRQRIFDYDDCGKGEKASRVLAKAIERKLEARNKEQRVEVWAGCTARELPSHLFVSSTDGHLYDTRRADWHKAEPLRRNYERAHREIKSVSDLKATLRCLSGYPDVYLTNDGALLCRECVIKNFRHIVDDIKQPLGHGTGWRVVASTYEAVSADCAREVSEDLVCYCDQCNKEFGELA